MATTKKNKQLNNIVSINIVDTFLKNAKLSSVKFFKFLVDICNKTTSTIMNKKPTHLYIYSDKINIKKKDMFEKKLIK